MTTIKITAASFPEALLIRCNLSQASSPVEVDYLGEQDSEFTGTQYQCSDVRHSRSELAKLGAELLAKACECSVEELGDWTSKVK